jgi:hypothetical protein
MVPVRTKAEFSVSRRWKRTLEEDPDMPPLPECDRSTAVRQLELQRANFASRFSGVTQMVINKTEHREKGPAKQGTGEVIGEPNKIGPVRPMTSRVRI